MDPNSTRALLLALDVRTVWCYQRDFENYRYVTATVRLEKYVGAACLLGNIPFELCRKSVCQNASLDLRPYVVIKKNTSRKQKLISCLLKAYKYQCRRALSAAYSV